jgi:putative DNA primase/helicase
VTAANGLTEADYLMREQSWIPRQLADDAGIRRVSSSEGADTESAGEILARAGIPSLTGESGIDEVEAAIRRLSREMAGADSIRGLAVRSAAVRHLHDIGIQAPAQLVDAALAHRQDSKQGNQTIAFPEPEPWPSPVDGAALLDEISGTLRRFAVLPLPEIHAVALWIVHTYAVEATSICPILIVRSAEKRCGKTLLMELLFDLVFRPLPTSNVTASSVFRTVEKYRPTLLLDEADTFLHNGDELRGILNSGYRRSSSYVIRTVGEDFEPVVFNTFGSKAIAQISTPPETIADRGIIVEMRRKKPDERPERLRSDRIFNELEPLRRKTLRWTRDNLALLKDREPSVPASLHDRAQDSWRPLLAVAELAGPTWAGYARESAVRLSEDKSEISKRTLLLADIRTLFRKARTPRITSADICAGLFEIEEHPWSEWRDGKPITVRQLARMLEPLEIRPRQLRMGEANVRGYELEDFSDSFDRYLADLPEEAEPSSQPPTVAVRGEDEGPL